MRPTSVVEKWISTKLYVKNTFQAQIRPTSVVEKCINFINFILNNKLDVKIGQNAVQGPTSVVKK